MRPTVFYSLHQAGLKVPQDLWEVKNIACNLAIFFTAGSLLTELSVYVSR